MTEDYTLDGSHYPKAILARTTPVVLLLFITSLGAAFMAYRSAMGEREKYALWLLYAFIFFFVLMMTIGAKKGDRYIIPVFFAIDALAIYAIFAISSMLRRFKAGPAIGLGVVIYLTATVISYHPYAIAYANPLFPDNLSQELGWGEGLDQVGAWLSANHPKARVASWYSEELGAFTSANVLNIGAHAENTVQYVVLYHNMFGRAPEHPANDYIDEYYKKRNPIFTAYVHGKEFAWVYEKKTYPGNYGELLRGDVITQTVPVNYDPVGGVEVLVATYRDRAVSGELHVELEGPSGKQVYAWAEPVAKFEDDLWHQFILPEDVSLQGEDVLVRIYTTGTSEGAAPTIRKASDGGAAVRLLYNTGTQLINEEHTKLLLEL